MFNRRIGLGTVRIRTALINVALTLISIQQILLGHIINSQGRRQRVVLMLGYFYHILGSRGANVLLIRIDGLDNVRVLDEIYHPDDVDTTHIPGIAGERELTANVGLIRIGVKC